MILDEKLIVLKGMGENKQQQMYCWGEQNDDKNLMGSDQMQKKHFESLKNFVYSSHYFSCICTKETKSEQCDFSTNFQEF